MDRRNKRNEATDKKNDSKIKDRGDLKKVGDKIIKKGDEIRKVVLNVAYPERGDSERKTLTNQKLEKMRVHIASKKPTNEDYKFKSTIDGAADYVASRKKTDKDSSEHHQYEIELRKRIRDKYTLKLKPHGIKNVQSNSNLNKKDDAVKVTHVKGDGSKTADRPKKQLIEETTQTKEMYTTTSSGKTDINGDKKTDKLSTKPDKNSTKPDRNGVKPERNSTRRKPIIKTIMSKNGSVRIYKAVTFVDQKPITTTPLEIKIPGDSIKKQKVSKFTDTGSLKLKTKATISRANIKEKPVAVRKKSDRKRERKSKYVPSPTFSIIDKSPPTEVARWAPNCIDHHTKPYYEAWVNTTLAAIYKSSKKDKRFIEKHRESILQSLQRSIERPVTPELFYANMADEKYTGRIKITHR